MAWGRHVPDGHLPVYSVGSEEEAHSLVILACGTNGRGEYIAKELVMDQTLENLRTFSDRLDRAHDILVKAGKCTYKNMRKGKKKP